MPHPAPSLPARDALVSYYWSGDALRSRSVSEAVLQGAVDIPALPARLLADWERETVRLGLQPGDVEALSLPRARAQARWPNYRQCVQAAAAWARSLGLNELLAASDIALMACRGARYHHDGAQYGDSAFCNLFLGEDQGLDVHFPGTGQRIPLVRGTALVFDTGQPHAVVRRGGSGFDAADFEPGRGSTTLFLTWELPIENVEVTRLLGIAFDTDPTTASQLEEQQVRCSGAPASVCPASGRWMPVR